MSLRRLTLGTWDAPRLPLEAAPRAAANPSRIEISTTQNSICPPLDSHYDPAGRGLVDELLKPRKVVAEGVSVFFFNEASLFSRRLIVTPDDGLYADCELTPRVMEDIMAGRADMVEAEHQISHDGGGVYTSPVLSRPPVRLDGVHILLTSSEPGNYGAWLIRVLPKLHTLKQAGVFETGRMLCVINHDWQKSLLSWMGVSLDRLVHQTPDTHYSVETLIVPTWPSQTKFLDDGIRRFIAETRQHVLQNATPVRGRMIYVSRQGWSAATDRIIALMPGTPRIRAFDQEQELSERLAALGIESFRPEEHSFEETLAVFARAEFVVGPQGAGLFNAIFCRPGTPVIEIAHLPYFARGHANMFLSCGLRYMVVVGEDPEFGAWGAHEIHRALKIDMDGTVAFIARQLEALAAIGEDEAAAADTDGQRPRRAARIITELRDEALAAAETGDARAAVEAWEALRRIVPNNLESVLGQAAALQSLGRHEDMQRLLAEAPEWCPGNGALLAAKARNFAAQDDWPRSAAAWSEMLVHRPREVWPLIEFIHDLGRQGKWDAAEMVLYAVCAGKDVRYEVLAAQANLAAHRHDLLLAERRWAAVVTRFPDTYGSWCGHITTCSRLNDFVRAEAVASQAAALFPAEPAVLTLHAKTAVAALNWAEAERRWGRVRGLTPGHAEAWLQQAIALRASGRSSDAEALLTEAAKLFPDEEAITKLRRSWRLRSQMGVDRLPGITRR